MSESWEVSLERWRKAGLLDTATAEKIRQFETTQEQPSGLRWPVLIAIAFGALLLAAGVLLFVSAHWDEMSPSGRFSLVLALVAVFHLAGGFFADRFPALATALHGVGTASLGAGIYLAAQIFNMQEHWPGGVLLWAIGSAIGWLILSDWVQAGFVAILVPAWLVCEWVAATERYKNSGSIMGQGLLLLAVTYLTALTTEQRTPTRRVLAWIGGIALVPAAIIAIPETWWWGMKSLSLSTIILGKALGLIAPLLLAWWLRGRAAVYNLIAAVWVLVLGFISPQAKITPYIWAALAALGLIAWGLYEARRERINLGIFGFGVTVLLFYFSNVMDKLDRSASLIGLGILFLVLAWGLERTRRRLVAKVRAATA